MGLISIGTLCLAVVSIGSATISRRTDQGIRSQYLGSEGSSGPRVAHVSLVPGMNPNVRGELILEQENPSEPLIVRGTIQGLADGNHGFHVHEFGDLGNFCFAAGEHFNPTSDVHGGPRDVRKHVGDFGNVRSVGGEAEVYVEAHQISLFEGPNSVVGRAVVVHIEEDDLGRGRNQESLRTGNSGGRAGCGIIELEGGAGFHHRTPQVGGTASRSPHARLDTFGSAAERRTSGRPEQAWRQSGGKQHMFEVGKHYEYSFESWMTTGIPEIAPQYAGFSLKGTLTVEPIDDSSVAFTLTDATAKSFNKKIEGAIDPEVGEPMKIEDESVLQRTITLYYSSGKVVGLTSSGENESPWITNIHKSIASQLQFQWSSEKEKSYQDWVVKASALMEENAVYNVREESVTGDCEVWYEVSKIPAERIHTSPGMLPLKSACSSESEIFEIVKTKNFDKCKKTGNFNILSPVGMKCKPSSSGCETTAQRTSTTRILTCGPMTSQSGVSIQKITTVEKINIDPYGHDTEGLEGTSIQRLQLTSVKEATGRRPRSIGGEPSVKSLVFSYFPSSVEPETTALPQPTLHESSFSLMFKSMNLGKKIEPMLESIVSDLQSSEFESSPSSKFISDRMGGLRRVISYMDYNQLRETVGGVMSSTSEGSISRQMLLDGLMSAGSNPAIVLTLELISSGKVSGERALQAVSMLPLVVRTPTKELFSFMLTFLSSTKNQKLKETTALAITTLAHHACVSKTLKKFRFPTEAMGDFCKPDEPFIIDELLPWLKSELDSAESVGTKAVYLAALNNLAHEATVPIIAPYIEDCSGRETRHRRSGELDLSQYEHGNLEEEEVQALKAWRKILLSKEEEDEKEKPQNEKSELVKEMKKFLNKIEEEPENSKVKVKSSEKKKMEVKKETGEPSHMSKVNKKMLKAIVEMMEAEDEEEAEAARKQIVKMIEKGSEDEEEESSEKSKNEKKNKEKSKVELKEETSSVPKLRKKIMKVVSLLVDAETEEDLEKARTKLQKMITKVSSEGEEDEEEEEEKGSGKTEKDSKKDAKLQAKLKAVEQAYKEELEEMEEKRIMREKEIKMEAKKSKLQAKRKTRMIHGTKSLFDDEGCRVLRSKAVFGLSKLAYTHNKRVMPILKSLFFNTAEDYQVRLSALTLIMASNPPLGIWERIAVGTWFDPHPDVVSFFYSSLRSISMSTNPNLRNSRARATAVLPLAKPSTASPTNSWNFLTGRYSEMDVLGFTLQLSSFGSSTSYLPDNYYTRYSLQSGAGDTTLFELSKYGKQMEKFIDTVMLKLVKAGVTNPEILNEASEALENIHKQLKIEERAAGSPESHIYFSLMESIQRMVTIDEHTLARIVETIVKSEFTGGIHLSHYKWQPLIDVTSVVPSESGIPFIFNSHARVFASVKGTVKGSLIEKALVASVAPTATLKMYSQLAVDVPFSSKILATGVDTHVSFALPGIFTAGFSKSSGSVTLGYEPSTSTNEPITFTHIHVRPFTVSHEKRGMFLPMSTWEDTVVVTTEDDPKSSILDYEDSFGFRYKIRTSKDIGSAFRAAGGDDILSSIFLAWVPSSLRMREYTNSLDIKNSDSKKIELILSAGKIKKRNPTNIRGKQHSKHFESQWGSLTEEMEDFSANIFRDVPEGEAYLASAHVQSTRKAPRSSTRKYSLNLGLGATSSGRKRMVNLRAGGKDGTAMICVDGSFDYPHVAGVQRESFYEADLKTSWSLNIGFGSSCKDSTIEVTGYAERSKEARKKHRQSREYAECTRLEERGLGANVECLQLRREATSLDTCVMDIKFDNLPPYYINRSMILDDSIRLSLSKYASHNPFDVKNPKGLVRLELEMIPHTNLANLRIFKPSSNTFFTGIKTPSYLSSALPLNARLGPTTVIMHPEGSPVCLIDRNHVTTFDKVHYNASLSSCNHVLAKDCSGRYKVAVLGRKEANTKVVTILASTEAIELDPSEGKVFVNDDPVRLSNAPLNLETQNGEPFARIYKTEDGFLVAEMPSHGMTVKLNPQEIVILPSVVHKGRTCGMCGYYDNQKDAEFRGPTGCVLSTGELLAEAYKLQRPIGISKREPRAQCGVSNRQVAQRLMTEQSVCHEMGGMKYQHYQPGVIPTRISELAFAGKSGGRSGSGCEMIKRNRMEERNGMTCFSIEAAPACKPGCRPVGLVSQRLSFHCMPPGSRTDRYVAEHHYHQLRYFEDEKPFFQMAVSTPIDCRPE